MCMKKFFTVLFILFFIGFVTLCASSVWIKYQIIKPGALNEAQEFLVEPGSSGYSIAQNLADAGIVAQPKIFYGLLRFQMITIKAGEYLIPARSSMKSVLDIFKSTKAIDRSFTLAEGLTVKQAIILLNDNPLLTGNVTLVPDEGTLLPDTYSFVRGATRDSIIKRMQEAHEKFVTQLWQNRPADFPLQSPLAAITLASIVERETGVASERTRVAGLFFNRLKAGMPLQSDPTVVYVITDGLGHMKGKRLYSKDLKVESPYNTYKNNGLPPGPIANPGRASLEAVFHPEQNDYLYFVADGTGGHVFAKDLKGHTNNVKAWRKFRKEKKI
jgi:UPF0755 protein